MIARGNIFRTKICFLVSVSVKHEKCLLPFKRYREIRGLYGATGSFKRKEKHKRCLVRISKTSCDGALFPPDSIIFPRIQNVNDAQFYYSSNPLFILRPQRATKSEKQDCPDRMKVTKLLS